MLVGLVEFVRGLPVARQCLSCVQPCLKAVDTARCWHFVENAALLVELCNWVRALETWVWWVTWLLG
eukprot:103471-Amphidinium_carterae.1